MQRGAAPMQLQDRLCLPAGVRWRVVMFRQMREHEVPQTAVKHLRDELRSLRVG